MLMAAIVASLALGAGPQRVPKPVDAGLYAPCLVTRVAELRREEWTAPFRAVALDLPRVWVVNRDGGVSLFEIDPEKRHQFFEGAPVIATDAVGDDVALVGRSLFLPRNGALHRFEIAQNNTLTPSGVFGAPGKWSTRAIVSRGTDAFVLDAMRIGTFKGLGDAQGPTVASTLESPEIWLNADASGRFLYASYFCRDDESKGIAIFEVGPDGSLTRRGSLRTADYAMGVRALTDGRVALLSDTHTNRLTLVDVADPDLPVVEQVYAVPTSRCSVLANLNGIDILMTGRDCLLFEKEGVSRLPYPYDSRKMLDGANYFGAAEGIFCAITTDDAIHITAFDAPIFRK